MIQDFSSTQPSLKDSNENDIPSENFTAKTQPTDVGVGKQRKRKSLDSRKVTTQKPIKSPKSEAGNSPRVKLRKHRYANDALSSVTDAVDDVVK